VLRKIVLQSHSVCRPLVVPLKKSSLSLCWIVSECECEALLISACASYFPSRERFTCDSPARWPAVAVSAVMLLIVTIGVPVVIVYFLLPPSWRCKKDQTEGHDAGMCMRPSSHGCVHTAWHEFVDEFSFCNGFLVLRSLVPCFFLGDCLTFAACTYIFSFCSNWCLWFVDMCC
jgi:hypothetical protein